MGIWRRRANHQALHHHVLPPHLPHPIRHLPPLFLRVPGRRLVAGRVCHLSRPVPPDFLLLDAVHRPDSPGTMHRHLQVLHRQWLRQCCHRFYHPASSPSQRLAASDARRPEAGGLRHLPPGWLVRFPLFLSLSAQLTTPASVSRVSCAYTS